jgi:hypothetical protein
VRRSCWGSWSSRWPTRPHRPDHAGCGRCRTLGRWIRIRSTVFISSASHPVSWA